MQIITDDDVDRISLCVRVVAERVPLMKNIFTVECRNSLSSMLDANKRGEEEKLNKVSDLFYPQLNGRKTIDNSKEKLSNLGNFKFNAIAVSARELFLKTTF